MKRDRGSHPPQRQVPEVRQRLQQALALHQRGLSSDATKICEAILKEKPDHFDALHLLGAIAYQGKDAHRAEALFSEAIKVNPGVAEAYNNWGSALNELRRFDEAVASYDKAISLKPNYAAAYNNRGITLRALNLLDQALASYHQAVALKPDYAEAYYNRGNALKDLKRLDEALASYDRAIALKPGDAAVHNNRGNALKDLDRLDEALASYDKAIALRPGYAVAHNNRGISLNQLKRFDEAVDSCNQAIALRPDYAEAYHNRGNALSDLRRLDEALASYDRAVALRPDYAEAYNNRGNALRDLKRLDEALASYDKAVALRPDYAEAYNNRSTTLNDLGRFDEALADCDRAIALRPDYAEAYNNRGNALRDLKHPDQALAGYDKAVALKPGDAFAHNNRGNALRDLKRYDEALACYDRAISLRPDYAEAHYNRGLALRDLRRPDEAIESYDTAISLKPDYAEAYINRGNVLRGLERFDEALASFDKAIALESAEGYNNRGGLLIDLGRRDEALASYERALSIKPDLVGAEGTRLHAKMHLCDWTNFDAECAHLISSVRDGKANTAPFGFLGISSSPADQLQCARNWVAVKFPPSKKAIWQGDQYRHDKIRIAYVSADYREHPVAYLIAGMIERHDRSRFDTTAISIGPDEHSQMRERLKASFGQFIDAKASSDEQIASLVRSLEVDILIDLMGFTTHSRTGIFALRPAPIQVNYLGYAGSMGANYIDYIVADRLVIPEREREFYSEKILYLPNSFMAGDSKRKISARLPRRSEYHLPETGFVFCAFNNSYKITPRTFDIWMRLLRSVEGSALWLSKASETAIRNLKREAQNRGVDPDRLVFAERVPLNEDHLARHQLADLFLDTLTYNAHATSSDALWAGLPVLTCLGGTFAGRVAASLLNAIGLSELITATPEAYEQKAIDLAMHPEKLRAIRQRLAANRSTRPLFDTQLFTGHIEAAYIAMVDRHRAGLAPDHIVVLQ